MNMATQEDYIKYRQIIGDKYKYLFLNEFNDRMEVFEFYCDDVGFNYEKSVAHFSLYMKVDANYPCDGLARDVGNLLERVDMEILQFLYDHPMNPKTLKFEKNDNLNVSVSEGLILNITYKLDEIHKIGIAYNISYDI